jgi:succinate dehydrogenase / fumarate reductase flavoprotein subunit
VHSIAKERINAAKLGDGDSVFRLFYDTVREAITALVRLTFIVWPKYLLILSTNVFTQGVPFAREYGGLLDNRSRRNFSVSYFYAKGQTGQQLLLGAYSAMNRQMGRGKITMHKRHEMLDLVIVDGRRGIIIA